MKSNKKRELCAQRGDIMVSLSASLQRCCWFLCNWWLINHAPNSDLFTHAHRRLQRGNVLINGWDRVRCAFFINNEKEMQIASVLCSPRGDCWLCPSTPPTHPTLPFLVLSFVLLTYVHTKNDMKIQIKIFKGRRIFPLEKKFLRESDKRKKWTKRGKWKCAGGIFLKKKRKEEGWGELRGEEERGGEPRRSRLLSSNSRVC